MEPCCQVCGTSQSECFTGRGGWVEGWILDRPVTEARDASHIPGYCWRCMSERMTAEPPEPVELLEAPTFGQIAAQPDRQHALSLAQGWHFDRGNSTPEDIVATARTFAAFLEADDLRVSIDVANVEPFAGLLSAVLEVLDRCERIDAGYMEPGLRDQVRDVAQAVRIVAPAPADA